MIPHENWATRDREPRLGEITLPAHAARSSVLHPGFLPARSRWARQTPSQGRVPVARLVERLGEGELVGRVQCRADCRDGREGGLRVPVRPPSTADGSGCFRGGSLLPRSPSRPSSSAIFSRRRVISSSRLAYPGSWDRDCRCFSSASRSLFSRSRAMCRFGAEADSGGTGWICKNGSVGFARGPAARNDRVRDGHHLSRGTGGRPVLRGLGNNPGGARARQVIQASFRAI